MKTLFVLPIIAAFGFSLLPAQNLHWSHADQPWPESFGSQRAIIEVNQPSAFVEIDLLWRRHDRNPDERRLLLIEASSGDTIKNVKRLVVNPERCIIHFGPVTKPGIYYFYYLPFEVLEGWGFYGKGYLKPEPPPDPGWAALSEKENIRPAKILGIECRTSFDTFSPMEIIPTGLEKAAFLKKFSSPVLYFTENRENPIRMKDEIPLRWVQSGPADRFSGSALQNEYYAFQIGVFAVEQDIADLRVIAGKLTGPGKSGKQEIYLTCFNTQGVDPYGIPFTKKLSFPAGRVQSLWIGADIPENAKPGKYSGLVTISGANITDQQISILIEVAAPVLADRGDSEPWRHSRLRWLNSSAGSDGNPVDPYIPINQLNGNSYQVAGHVVSLLETGLPEMITHHGASLLSSPVTLTVETAEGASNLSAITTGKNLTDGRYTQTATYGSEDLQVNYTVGLDYDGYLKTLVTFKNLSKVKPLAFKDIRLSIPFAAGKAKYLMGMGLPGCAVPPVHESKWKGPSDSFWIGDAEGGIWCELRGSSYHGPLLNLYRPAPPESWNNEGKGGFRIFADHKQVTAQVYSGSRNLGPGDSLQFEWAILITPVKELNPGSQFTDRYYHSGAKPSPARQDFDAGVQIINVHHANEYNPFINYPFIAVNEMRSFIDSIHALGRKVKIYYTVRELTNHVTEIWALRSLGHEILDDGRGGGYPWLREHFVDGYLPQWYQHFPDGRVDASVLSAPGDSRWLNYYIEGLAWLVKNVDIDGLYLDDVTFDRPTLQRMRSVMAQAKPGCIIDLHSNTGFSIGPANQYAGFFPYVDKIWFGESFQYDKMSPENWLVEVSGIPFGLMGDMLQGGGNRWLGMVFGMTVRYPWTTEGVLCDPRPVWKIWDEFRIQDSKMVGFWDPECPIQTNVNEVKATAYTKPGKVLVSIGNFSDKTQMIKFQIDWKTLGINPDLVRMYAPGIENFQPEAIFNLNDPIPVEARKGWLIFLENLH